MTQDKTTFFDNLSKEESKHLKTISKTLRLQKGNHLFFEGETPISLYFLTKGIIRIYKTDPKGNEILLHFIQAGSFVAELAHMQHIHYPATAICESDCELLAIDYWHFEKDFLTHPIISLKIITSLCQKILNLEKVITQNLTMDANARICQFLYENESNLKTLSQRKIAAILNMTPETLSRHIALLKEQGILSVKNREILLLQKEKLKQFFTL